jgi:Spy/CpxP family protein refolding chaperone
MGDGPGGFGDGPGLLLPLMLRAGELTPEQEQQVRAIMSGDRAKIHALFDQIDAANDALAAKIVGPGSVDAAALQPEIERIAALRTELLKEGLQSALAIRAVLTPEQLARAAQKRTRMMELQQQMRELMDTK